MKLLTVFVAVLAAGCISASPGNRGNTRDRESVSGGFLGPNPGSNVRGSGSPLGLNLLDSVVGGLANAGSSLVATAGNTALNIVDTVGKTAGNTVVNLADTAGKSAVDLADTVGKSAVDLVGNVGNTVGKVVTTVVKTTGDAVGDLTDSIVNNLSGDLLGPNSLLDGILTHTGKVLGLGTPAAISLFSSVSEAFRSGDILRTIKSVFSAIQFVFNLIVNELLSVPAVSQLLQAVSSPFGRLQPHIKNLQQELRPVFTDPTRLFTDFDIVSKNIGNAASSLFNECGSVLSGIRITPEQFDRTNVALREHLNTKYGFIPKMVLAFVDKNLRRILGPEVYSNVGNIINTIIGV